MTKSKDAAFMQIAFELAGKAKGWASPNPNVGAVIVKNGRIIGRGYHERPGRPHAEAVALQEAGEEAKNGTLYVTLEPCVHWGRTPPCVDSLIEAGLTRAVIASYDPNPLVYKKGVTRLKQAGVDVSVGLLDEENIRLNETYSKYITSGMPFVTAKAAVSLDGKIATKKGSSKWISSPKTREHMQLFRGEHDAIMIGIQTLLTDDPLLTVRHPRWKGKQTVRIIADTRLRTPLGARILDTIGSGRILVLAGSDASRKKETALTQKGAEVIRVPQSAQMLDLKKALLRLGQEGLSSVLVEGGGRLLTSLIEGKLVDKIMVAISPKLIGGTEAPSFYQGKGAEEISQALSLKKIRTFVIDEDIILEGYF